MKKSNLIKLLTVTWLICVCTLYASLSQAGTITDNFAGPAINTQLWTPFEESQDQTLAQQEGELRIQLFGGLHGGAGVRSKFLLKGDFEMTLDYRLITWPEANGVKLGFEGPGADSDQVILVKRISWGPADPDPKEVYFAGFQDGADWSGGQVPTADLSGKLKLTRVGEVLTGYFLNQATSDWQPLAFHDYSVSGFEEWVEITLWASASGSTAPQDVEIAFDNFQVTYDQIKFISFPLAAVDLLLLN